MHVTVRPRSQGSPINILGVAELGILKIFGCHQNSQTNIFNIFHYYNAQTKYNEKTQNMHYINACKLIRYSLKI